MSPEKAKVVIIDDDPEWQGIIRERLVAGGHDVAAQITSYEEALEIINKLAAMKVDVIILDGNLREGHNDSQDGLQILRSIQENAPGIKVVGFGATKFPLQDTSMINVDLTKLNSTRLVGVVSRL